MAGKIKRIVKYGLATCGPCKEQERVLNMIHEKHPDIEVEFRDADEAKEEDLETFGIRGVPSIVLFDDDGDFITKRGLQTLDQVEAML